MLLLLLQDIIHNYKQHLQMHYASASYIQGLYGSYIIKKLWLLFTWYFATYNPMKKRIRERENSSRRIPGIVNSHAPQDFWVSSLPHYRQFFKSDEFNANILNFILYICISNKLLSCEISYSFEHKNVLMRLIISSVLSKESDKLNP